MKYLAVPAVLSLGLVAGCTTIGSAMSPYSEKFSCKNPDHGQCIHPEEAYNQAVAGGKIRSDPAVTNDKDLLKQQHRMAGSKSGGAVRIAANDSYSSYRNSVYTEMRGLLDAPVTPMLRQPQTVRTLVMPYASASRPDVLYMPRYVFSVLSGPMWVVGDYLVPSDRSGQGPVLAQSHQNPDGTVSVAASPIQGAKR